METLDYKNQASRSTNPGEPISRLSPEDWKHLQRKRYFAETLDSGAYPVVDKDAAEEILEDFRQVRGERHPRVAVVEERVRDGHPILTHIAISRLRRELTELVDKAHSQIMPHQRVLVPAQNEDLYAENR
jgi:hypothetical protein